MKEKAVGGLSEVLSLSMGLHYRVKEDSRMNIRMLPKFPLIINVLW